MAEEVGNLAVRLSLDSANFTQSMSSIERNLKALGQEMRMNQNHGKDWGNSITGLTTKQDSLTRMLDAQEIKVRRLREQYEQSKAETGENSRATENLAIQLNRATAEYSRTEAELAQVAAALQRQRDELRLAESSWTQLGERMRAVGATMSSVGDKMTAIGKNMSMKVTAPIVAMGTLATKASIDFESAFAGVKKTVDATDAEFAVLEKGIRGMAKEIPAAATEIASVAEAAGQLGIEKENILAFSRTMIDLGESTNLTADQAATAFARFANITQMPQTEFDKLGSVVVALGNTMATTEAEIVSMSMRLAAQGKQVGMSESQIMALAGTMSSLGIEAEAGGTAMTTILKKMQTAVMTGGKFLDKFAEAAGSNAKDFAAAWNNDPVEALDIFVKGLSASSEAGENLAETLAFLGIKGIREQDTLLRMAGASDLLSEAVGTSNKAWEENVALTNEAAQRYATTESQLNIMKNKLVDLGITIGNIIIPALMKVVEAIEPWIEKFSTLKESTQKTIVVIAGIAAAIGPVLVVIGVLVSSIGAILTAFGTASAAIAVMTTGVASAVPAVSALAAVFTVLTGPVGIAIAAIAGFAAVALIVYKNWEPIKTFFTDLWKTIEISGLAIWEVLKEAWASTVVFFKDTWSTITVFFSELWIGITDGASQVWEGVKESWTESIESLKLVWDDFKTAFVEKSTEILNKIVEIWEAIDVAVYTIVGTIVGLFIPTLVKMAASAVANAATVVASWVSMSVAATVNAVKVAAQWVVTSAAATASAVVHAVQAVPAIIASFVSMAASATVNAIKVAAQWVVMSAAATASALIQGVQAVGSIIAGFVSMAVSATAQALRVVAAWVTTGAAAIANAATHVAQVGIMVAKWVFLGAQSLLQAARVASAWLIAMGPIAWVTSAVVGLTVLIIANWDKVKSATTRIWTGITDAVTKAWSKVKEKTVEAVNALGDNIAKMPGKVTEFTGKMLTAGGDLVMGLIKGITGMASKAIDAITGVVDGVVGKAKSLLKIKSPSRVFMEIGDNTGMGMANGITGTKSANEKAIEGVSKVLSAAAKKNTEEIVKISAEAEKKRTEVQADYAKKRAELGRKSSQSAQSALKTSTNKKGQIVTTGAQKVHNIHADASAKLTKLNEDEQKKLATINTKAWADMQKKEAEISKARLESVKTYVADKKSLDEMSLVAESEVWRKSLALFQVGTKERVEIQKAYQASLKSINDEIVKVNDEYAGKMTAINDRLRKEEDDLTKAYEKSLDDRAKSLTNFVGVFDFFEVKIEKTGEDLMNNLTSQIHGFKRWQLEIEELSAKAIDEGLIEELRAMGPKALPELIALNSLSEKQMSQYSAMYKEKSALARTQAEKELIGMKSDTEKRIIELRAAANKELGLLQNDWTNKIKSITKATDTELMSLKTIGKNAGQGLLNGLASMESSLIAKARSIANAVATEMRSALQIKSPSRVMMEIGEYTGMGLAIGMEESIAGINRGARMMANAAVPDVGSVRVPGYSTQGGRVGSSTVPQGNNVTVHQENHFHSVKPSPSEDARLQKRASQEAALAWR